MMVRPSLSVVEAVEKRRPVVVPPSELVVEV